MLKKLISAAIALSFVFGLSACHNVGKTDFTTTAAQESETSAPAESTTHEEETTVTTTAATTLPVTTASTTAKPTTTKITTTKKPTTAKKPTTTKKIETTAATNAPSTSVSVIDYDRKEDHSDTVELKYGVWVSKAVTTYYKLLEDGSEIVVNEKVSEVYNRLGYYAAYADLLPAVKENREKYSEMIDKVLEIINGYRAEKGIAPLKINEKLMEISGARAEEIAWSGLHSHTRPGPKNWSSILKDGGITSGQAGENIGWGYDTAEAVCEAWKNSTTHYENLMNPEFTETGIGVAADPDSAAKLCWAQHFLKPKG